MSSLSPIKIVVTGALAAPLADKANLADLGSLSGKDSVASGDIDPGAVTNSRLASMGEATLKGRAAGSGPGTPVDLNATQVRGLLNVAAGATANDSDANLKSRANHTGTQAIATVSGLQAALDGKAAATVATSAVAGVMSAADKAKLDGIATAATANATNAQLRDRSTHTGSQAIATVAGLQAELDGKAPATAATSAVAGVMSAADKAKLDGIAAAATANATNVQLRDRSTHTGSQAITTITGLETALETKAAVTAAVQTQGKPGDVLDRFTATLNGTAASAAAPGGTLVETDDMGAALRQTGASVTALRERIAVWPDSVIRVRARIQRATNPTDPAGDTVRFAVNRLNKSKATISSPTVVQDVTLSVQPDPTVIEAVFAAGAGEGVDFAWTTTTRYIVPFVQTFGADGVTDIGEIAWEEVGAAASLSTGLAAEQNARIAAFNAEQTARINADSAEQTARIAAVAGEASARMSADADLQADIDASVTALTAATTDAANEKRRTRRIALSSLGQNVEDVETLAIRGGRRAMGVDLHGQLLALGISTKWGIDLEGEHRLAIIGDGDRTSFALNHDGSVFAVLDADTRAQLGGGIEAIDVPHGLFDREVFGASGLSPLLARAWSDEEGQSYSYVYRRDITAQAAIREGRGPIEGFVSSGQSLRVGGGALDADPHVLTVAPLARHINLMLDDGLRGPMSSAWNPAAASDFAPAVEAYVSTQNVGETGLAATMRYLSARAGATGRVQAPYVARADGRGGTILADLGKGSVPYANALSSLQRMGEIACGKYRRPFVVRWLPFGQGNADRASLTPRASWVATLKQLAEDYNADILALLDQFATAWPDLYADVALPTRVPLITAQLTDVISSSGDSGDDIVFAHIDAAEQSNLIYVSQPQYFYKDGYGYADAAHLQALGYGVQGEYDALACERIVWNGAAVGGLFPDRANIVRSGSNIVVPTRGRVGALRLNTTDLFQATGWGFNWSGAGSVTAVSFSGDDIVIAGTIGSGTLTYGNRHQTTAKPGGSFTYGNVCDSATADSLAVPGLKLTNWLPAFDKTL